MAHKECCIGRGVAALKIHGQATPKPSSIIIAGDRIARLQSEIESLKRKNSGLLEQFVI
jgi:hypothetical protein